MWYQNPIAKNGDYADPFVLKHNGRYYLYCTNPDIRCWSSDDLLHWSLEGPAIEEDTFPGLVPFAPEVVYWNGYFYMYTSPSGFGHYVLKSKSPTGPFRKISENVGHEIDGTVFIDDDGMWYFYWAGWEGIWGCEMKSPTEFGEPVLTGAFLNGWTEGPLVVKKDGIYYMTYTGNHYLSKGYRINACWSKTPLSGYRDDRDNPVVVRAEGRLTGLGHSSTVEGPDLVSDYLIYHNMNEDATRDLNVDRQFWYQEATQIAGPTQMWQRSPEMPDYAFLGRGKEELEFVCCKGEILYTKEGMRSGSEGVFALSKQMFPESFTAECNIRIKPVGQCGKMRIVLASDEENYLGIEFDSIENTVCILRQCGQEMHVIGQSSLPDGYGFEALHCVKICRDRNDKLEVYIDRRRQFVFSVEGHKAYRMGVMAQGSGLEIGYTAVTGSTRQEQETCAVFPVEGAFYPVFGKVAGERKADGSVLLKWGENAQYSIWAGEEGGYRCWITAHWQENGKAGIILDGVEVCTLEKDGTELAFFGISLKQGMHAIRIENYAGVLRIDKIKFFSVAQGVDHGDGLAGVELNGYGKRLAGNTVWSNYTVSAALLVECGENGNAGILLRVTEPSEGGEGADLVLGVDFFIGYSVSLTGEELVIMRHRYDEKVLGRCPYPMEADEEHCFKVNIFGASIWVYADGGDMSLLMITDEEPIENGCTGIWTKNGRIKISRFDVEDF